MYVLGPCGSYQWTHLWSWEFFPLPQPPQEFLVRGFEALFPCTGTLGWVLSHSPVVPPSLSSCKCGTTCSTSRFLAQSSSCGLAVTPPCPFCLSLPLLPVWMNVSSLVSWLSDFHTVQFSVISGYFCFKFVVLLLVVRGDTVCLPMPSSWLEVPWGASEVTGMFYFLIGWWLQEYSPRCNSFCGVLYLQLFLQ